MPAERLTMRKIREVFRLKFDSDISNRQIAKSCKGRKIICANDTFELREVLTPYGKARNLDSGNTFLWD